jgi:UDP:flavonoid glycosyltransferase YjiC (YdhE family)
VSITDSTTTIIPAMHAIVVAIGSHGDVHPFIGLGQALRARGNRVTFAANAYFEDLVRRAGFDDFEPIGTAEQFARGLESADLWHPIRGLRRVFELGVFPFMRRTYDLVVERHVPGETVVASHVLGLGARVASERHGIPLASVQLSPAVFRTVHEVPTLPGLWMPRWLPRWAKRRLWDAGDRLYIDPFVGPPVNALRREVGLAAPVRGIMRDYWLAPRLVLAMFPDWFGRPQPDWPAQVRMTGFPLYDEADVAPLSSELEAFLGADGGRGDARPIVFTPGSAMTHGQAFFAAAADACRRLGRRGILLSRHHGHIPASLPPGVRHFDYAPFSRLLPRSAAIVHHGGVGTTAQALAAGVPQLVVPMAHDQLDNAERVCRLGVGLSLPPKRFSGERAARALARLLDSPAASAACGEVARRFRGIRSPLDDAAELVEGLVTSGTIAGAVPAAGT